MLEIKVGRHVQTVRSDRGREFDNAAVHKLLVDRGAAAAHCRLFSAAEWSGRASSWGGVYHGALYPH
jgi:hypothetical protein